MAGAMLRPGPCGLEQGGQAQHAEVVKTAPDDLQPDGQARLGEASRDGSRQVATARPNSASMASTADQNPHHAAHLGFP
jgi:hypothetical protein